jgi:hypothetical protein
MKRRKEDVKISSFVDDDIARRDSRLIAHKINLNRAP